jgi:hypothetical protein
MICNFLLWFFCFTLRNDHCVQPTDQLGYATRPYYTLTLGYCTTIFNYPGRLHYRLIECKISLCIRAKCVTDMTPCGYKCFWKSCCFRLQVGSEILWRRRKQARQKCWYLQNYTASHTGRPMRPVLTSSIRHCIITHSLNHVHNHHSGRNTTPAHKSVFFYTSTWIKSPSEDNLPPILTLTPWGGERGCSDAHE